MQNVKVIGVFRLIKDDGDREQQEKLIKEIKEYEQKYKRIVSEIKKETQFDKKVDLNIEAQKIKRIIEGLKQPFKNYGGTK